MTPNLPEPRFDDMTDRELLVITARSVNDMGECVKDHAKRIGDVEISCATNNRSLGLLWKIVISTGVCGALIVMVVKLIA
jgi:hypothetical protein